MDVDIALHQFLVLYTWFPLAALLVFFLLIARFYQRFSEVRTFYFSYIVSMILFGALAIRQAGLALPEPDVISAALSLFGGILVVMPVLWLARVMLRHKNQDD